MHGPFSNCPVSITTIWPNQEFLALKWVITEQFQEYLLRKPFVVKTNNNLLTYVMTTPNFQTLLDSCWVESLTGFALSIGYQKGCGNAAADALSWVTSRLDMQKLWSPSWMEWPCRINRKSRCSWPSGGRNWWWGYAWEWLSKLELLICIVNLHVTGLGGCSIGRTSTVRPLLIGCPIGKYRI